MQFYRINFSSRAQKAVPFNSSTFYRGIGNGYRKFVAIESGLSAFGKRINRFPISSFVVALRTHNRNAHWPSALRPPLVADRFDPARAHPCPPISAPFRSDRRERLDCRRRNLEMKMISTSRCLRSRIRNKRVANTRVCLYNCWWLKLTRDRARDRYKAKRIILRDLYYGKQNIYRYCFKIWVFKDKFKIIFDNLLIKLNNNLIYLIRIVLLIN